MVLDILNLLLDECHNWSKHYRNRKIYNYLQREAIKKLRRELELRERRVREAGDKRIRDARNRSAFTRQDAALVSIGFPFPAPLRKNGPLE
jgi:hypothetical protein